MSDTLSFDLHLRFPGFRLAATAQVPAQGITALSGPSGSGKTTVLRAIAGLEPAARGHVRLGGRDITALSPAARGIGYVFQEARLFLHMDVAANLQFGARRRGVDAARVAQVIEALDLTPLLRRAPATLSGGEARRVALGRALASGPSLLLLDEPLAGLDRDRKAALMPYIARAVVAFGVPAVFVSHSAREIAALADRVLIMADGQITGCQPAAPRLTGPVGDVLPGMVRVDLGDRQAWVPGTGQVGDIWSVPLGSAYVVSTRDPGNTTAPFCIRGEVIGPDPQSDRIRMAFGNDALCLPCPTLDAVEPGQPVWLTLPDLAGYPRHLASERRDSP